MTPEQAKEMLARPWGVAPVVKSVLLLEAVEQIASMRYEYLVQEDVGYLRDHGAPFDTLEEARQYRDMKREDAPMMIVRRLVTDWEVVEHD